MDVINSKNDYLKYLEQDKLALGKKYKFPKLVHDEIWRFVAVFSFMIEFTQLLFHLGTFQISDLFFNTIGGLVGGIIYFLVNAMAERIRRIRN